MTKVSVGFKTTCKCFPLCSCPLKPELYRISEHSNYVLIRYNIDRFSLICLFMGSYNVSSS